MSRRYKQKRRERYYREVLGVRFEDDGPDVCWCGIKNPYFHPINDTCGGSGLLNCHCGGDQCVCHNHGEVECFGCEDCQSENDQDFYDQQDGWNESDR